MPMGPYVPRNIRQLRRLLTGIPVGMLTTQSLTGESRSRPMIVHDVDDSGWLWFLTDRSSRKACELIQNPRASVVFQSPHGDRFVALQGTAIVVRDNVQLKRMWNPTYRSWFPKGKTDPAIVLVALRVTHAEYWLVPRTSIVRAAGAVKAMITGRRHEAPQHGVLDLQPLSV
jgi:general stress protein 26